VANIRKIGNFLWEVTDGILEDMIGANIDIYRKLVDDERFEEIIRTVMFKRVAHKLAGVSAPSRRNELR